MSIHIFINSTFSLYAGHTKAHRGTQHFHLSYFLSITISIYISLSHFFLFIFSISISFSLLASSVRVYTSFPRNILPHIDIRMHLKDSIIHSGHHGQLRLLLTLKRLNHHLVCNGIYLAKWVDWNQNINPVHVSGHVTQGLGLYSFIRSI